MELWTVRLALADEILLTVTVPVEPVDLTVATLVEPTKSNVMFAEVVVLTVSIFDKVGA